MNSFVTSGKCADTLSCVTCLNKRIYSFPNVLSEFPPLSHQPPMSPSAPLATPPTPTPTKLSNPAECWHYEKKKDNNKLASFQVQLLFPSCDRVTLCVCVIARALT